MRRVLVPVCLLTALVARSAHADEKALPPAPTDGSRAAPPPPPAPPPASKLSFAGGHVGYAFGPAAGDDHGFRQALDIGAMVGFKSYDGGSSSGLPSQTSGTIFGVSSLLGFRKYPSYVTGEIGGGGDNAFTGGFGVIGPAVRVDPKAGGGVALRLGGDVFLLEVAVRLIAIFVPDRELVFALTLGVGRD
jgi:hypothetical protein